MKITSAKFVRGVIGTNDILYDGLPQIAFVGRSNVGKSSFINSLVGREDLVKVGRKPGKTTEINFFLINREFYFVDLPGYGYARLDPKEKEKIRKRMLWYLTESGVRPSLVVLILDIKAGFMDFDKVMADLLMEEGHPFLVIANKVDKMSKKEVSQQITLIKEKSGVKDVIPCSTVTKEGIETVLDFLLKKVYN